MEEDYVRVSFVGKPEDEIKAGKGEVYGVKCALGSRDVEIPSCA